MKLSEQAYYQLNQAKASFLNAAHSFNKLSWTYWNNNKHELIEKKKKKELYRLLGL